MPNLKVYVEESVWNAQAESLTKAFSPLRELLCEGLQAKASACQFALIPFKGMQGQANISVEMQYLPKPERSKDRVLKVCERIQGLLVEATGCTTAVRAAALDPATYIVVSTSEAA